MRHLYLGLAVLGFLLPFTQLARFLAIHGPDVRLGIAQLLGTPISSFFAADVVISGLTVLALAIHQRRVLGTGRLALCLAATIGVGPSCGLPLLLYLRSAAARPAQVGPGQSRR